MLPHVSLQLSQAELCRQKRRSVSGTTASEDRSTAGIEVWEEADPLSFMVRGRNYANDRKKFLASGAIYR